MKALIPAILCLLSISFTGWAQESSVVQTQSLKNFVSDGCTMFPEGTSENPELWESCCLEHDLRYWFGGTKQDRDVADTQLRQCVQHMNKKATANLMYVGVKLGHLSPIKNKYAWGWGWQTPIKKRELTAAEKQIVLERLDDMGLADDFRNEFIAKYLIP